VMQSFCPLRDCSLPPMLSPGARGTKTATLAHFVRSTAVRRAVPYGSQSSIIFDLLYAKIPLFAFFPQLIADPSAFQGTIGSELLRFRVSGNVPFELSDTHPGPRSPGLARFFFLAVIALFLLRGRLESTSPVPLSQSEQSVL